MSSLLVDWCSYEAAKFAVLNWHYSKSMPAFKRVCIGAWENDKFIGSVVFSLGANKNIGSPYKLEQEEVCELTRVALGDHTTSTSRIVAKSVQMIKRQSPLLRLIVSYADTEQKHLGTIYQAMNWVYVGEIKTTPTHFVNGRWMKQRMASSLLGSVVGTKRKPGFDKHKYLYPLDRAMRRQILPLAQPYPKKEHAGEVSTVTRRNQPEIAGSSPAARSEMTGQEPVLLK